MMLRQVELAFYGNGIAAGKQLHIFRRWLNVNSIGGDLPWIDSVDEFDIDRRFVESRVPGDDPLDFERRRLARRQNF